MKARTVLTTVGANDGMHPGKQGYKGNKLKKKDKLDKPNDKDLDVVENSKVHVKLAYATKGGGTHEIHAQIFGCDISHKDYADKPTATMWIGFEIEKPTSGSALELKTVSETGPYLVTVDFNGIPIDIILNESSPQTDF